MTADIQTVHLSVPEMDCPSCAGKVESSVERLPGIQAVEPTVTTGRLVVSYDPAVTDREAVVDRIEAAGYAVEASEPRAERLSVPEMDCASCAGKVEHALAEVDGIVSYETMPATGTVVVEFDAERASRGAVVAAVEGAGYGVEDAADESGDADAPSTVWRSTRALKTWGGAVALLVGLVLAFGAPAADSVVAELGSLALRTSDIAFLVATAVAGVPILRNGYYSLRNRSLDIDLLMSAGIVGALTASLAFGESLYFEAATLAVLFSIAELLERYSMDRARHSLTELMDLAADTATVVRDGEERTVPVEDVAVGERVVVRPGERVPVDGTVREGESAVNESPITGESVPVDKAPGDEVFAGTVTEAGYLEVEADAEAGESTLAHIVELVEDAQREKTRREQFVERFARYYTPVVVVLAVLTASVPPLVLGWPWREWFVNGLTLLVIACPCAFVISTPVSVVSGITSAARNGVLIKGGSYLEAMGEVETVALDKTGTLTTGELAVTDVVPLNGNTETDVLRCARALESRSEHPIATAIVDYADEHGVPDREVAAFESLTGKGVRADLDGTTHYAGKPALFADLGFDLDHVHLETDGGVEAHACEQGHYLDLAGETIPALQREGKTIVLVGTEERLEGVVAIADEVRPEAADAVRRLRERGLRVVMLTGDNERTARVIAEQVGVDDYRAGLLPEEKVDAVRELDERHDRGDEQRSWARRTESGGVAMVGDGINDAPALAAATVGVAMGAAGTDTALETADVALMADDLSKLPYLYALSHKANAVIRENIWASLAVKAALAVGVPFGVSLVVAIVVGDMGMSLGVTGNAMRLAGVSPDE